ncbi:hypothetical protein CVT24_005644 [Panaeolus cyanescens]|uniref:Condensin complex subunit 2 n=1 Tax=Panaeolus cyanescens TaxID=181874 RepID=A0A409VBP2_9AGAR|nr:hypothetical protein CVT24_005644 [Panaeolus cyanescens]
MAPSRRARSPGSAHVDFKDATDTESEEEAPRVQKSGLKKRLSEIHPNRSLHDDDGDFNPETGRPPLRAVNINDDAAEKRRRRKSTKLTMIENPAGPSGEGTQEEPAAAVDPARAAKQKLNTVAAPAETVPLDVMSSNFEEWMKMATDNKINAANTWNFALIDYFHDMQLLRNNDDNSINFQRASCTLDGCVKIWTSRVDSVSTETGKLLSNLESGGKGGEEDGEDSDNPDGEPSQGKKKKARATAGATLAKDPSQLKNKKPELEFAVDPLFRKTCADFDEGGAGGLLMNHLSLGIGSEGCMRVIFDGSDSMGKMDGEEIIEEPEDKVDLSYLRNHFMPDLEALNNKAISHSLKSFAFSKDSFNIDDTTFFQNDSQDLDDDDDDDGFQNDTGFGMQIADDNGQTEDFFVGADAVNDDFGGGDDYGDNQSASGSMDHAADGDNGQPAHLVPFDPTNMPNERNFVIGMVDDGEGGALDYFDKNFKKNWAGPEHWKLRRPIRSKAKGDDDDAEGETKGKGRQKKEAVKIDFLSAPEKSLKDLKKELFVGVGKGASINLPGTGPAAKKSKKKKEKVDDHLLPDDMHFSSKQLITLFLKPKFEVQMHGHKPKINQENGEVDENFWAQAAADQAANRDRDNDMDESNDAPIPFNTQFFHEDDFGPGFDDDGGYDGEGGGLTGADDEEDLLAATQGQSRRVRPEFVNYTKRAKRVDVRKLKENIWKGLDIVVAKNPKKRNPDESMDVDEEEEEEELELTNPEEGRQFSQVISGLQKSYPKEKIDEISTSFCFICLLHLANEQGLKLDPGVDDSSYVSEQTIVGDDDVILEDNKKIGNIWDIKIYRDPNATQAA